MGDLRATEMSHGRMDDPAGYVDSAPAPVMYTRYANHGPATPAPYDAPPLPPFYEPAAPRHFLPPYDLYAPEPPPSISLRDYGMAPNDVLAPYAANSHPPREVLPPYAAKSHPPREVLPPYDPPADMVIPGVQHPDGRFEPHPYFARRSAPGPPVEPVEPVEPEEPMEPSKKTVEVAVPVCCEACKERITNYVGETPGVDAVECDVNEQMVTVTGDLPPAEVLQLCRKCFRKSTLV